LTQDVLAFFLKRGYDLLDAESATVFEAGLFLSLEFFYPREKLLVKLVELVKAKLGDKQPRNCVFFLTD
jgi:hypothetical protein